MAEVEVRAAHNVVEACAQTDTIDKVVCTSSATAILWTSTHADKKSSDLDERHWSDINFCRNFKVYIYILYIDNNVHYVILSYQEYPN